MSEVALATAEPVDAIRKDVVASNSLRRYRDRRRLWRLVVAVNVVGLILFAVVLRCRGLGNFPGINGDEAWYGVQAELCLRGEPIAWHTPSGNLLNPLFFGPQLAMHAIFGPSFVVLRATAVASGLLALLLNYWLCRRVFGRTIAIISTSILAVLPIDIAYSRLAWDASQSLLATLPCIYFPLWAINEPRWKVRLSLAALAAMAIAIIVHPTNLFVAPIAVACLVYAWRAELLHTVRRIADWCRHRRNRIALIASSAVFVGVGMFAIFAAPELRRAWLWPAMARAFNPPQYAEFVSNFGRLFSGAAVYEYLSGALLPHASLSVGAEGFRWDCLPYDMAAWLVGGWLAFGRIDSRCTSQSAGIDLFGGRIRVESVRVFPGRGARCIGSRFRTLCDLDDRPGGCLGVGCTRIVARMAIRARAVAIDDCRNFSRLGTSVRLSEELPRLFARNRRPFASDIPHCRSGTKTGGAGVHSGSQRTASGRENRHERMVDLLADAISEHGPSPARCEFTGVG